MPTNRELFMRAAGTAINTGSLTGGGLLQPYQARQFIQQTFEATNLAPLVRHEMRVERRGEIDKIGIAPRLLREKKENTDDGYRAWVTPEEVIQYTSHEDVLKRPVEKLAFDISRAELKVIAKTNNSFGEEYPEIPESVKMAVILLAEAYAKNSIEATKKQIRSETFDDYSYSVESGTVDIEGLDIDDLLAEYVLAKGRGKTVMRMRAL